MTSGSRRDGDSHESSGGAPPPPRRVRTAVAAAGTSTVTAIPRRHWVFALERVARPTACNLYNAAMLATLVYRRRETVQTWFENLAGTSDRSHVWEPTFGGGNHHCVALRSLASGGYSDVEWYSDVDRGTVAFAVGCSDHALIVFRGTEPVGWRDWWSDFAAARVVYPYWTPESSEAFAQDLRDNVAGPSRYLVASGASAHLGFLRAFEVVRAGVEDFAQRYAAAHPRRPIYVIGHSLGGALALLGASVVVTRLPQTKVALYTFGQPRVFDTSLARHFSGSFVYFRVRHRNDIVPNVPASVTRLGPTYAHFGRRISWGQWLDMRSDLITTSSDVEDSPDEYPPVSGGALNVTNHMMTASYLPRMTREFEQAGSNWYHGDIDGDDFRSLTHMRLIEHESGDGRAILSRPEVRRFLVHHGHTWLEQRQQSAGAVAP